MTDLQQAPEVGGEDKVDYSQLDWGQPDNEPDTPQPDDAVSDENSDKTLYSEPDNEPGEPDWSDSDEDLARKFGWKPRAEWKGDVPPTFVDDPRAFIAGKTRALDEFSSLKEQLAATRRELMRLEQQQGEAFKSQAESRVAQLKEAYDKAFDLGDKKRASELFDQLVEAKAQAAREPVVAQPEVDPVVERATQSAVYQGWAQQNPWYNGNSFEDAAKTAYANQVGPALLQQMGLSYDQVMANPTTERQFYEAVAKEVNRAYGVQQSPMGQRSVPDIPQQQGRQSATTQRRSKGEASFAKLPDDAKQAFAYYVKRGVYSDDDKSRAEYTRDYLAQ